MPHAIDRSKEYLKEVLANALKDICKEYKIDIPVSENFDLYKVLGLELCERVKREFFIVVKPPFKKKAADHYESIGL